MEGSFWNWDSPIPFSAPRLAHIAGIIIRIMYAALLMFFQYVQQ